MPRVNEDQFGIDGVAFGERLRQALAAKFPTQKAAAEALGISENALSNYVRGRIPETAILLKIAQSCDVPMEWLLTGEGRDPPSILTFRDGLSLARDAIIEAFDRILTTTAFEQKEGWTMIGRITQQKARPDIIVQSDPGKAVVIEAKAPAAREIDPLLLAALRRLKPDQRQEVLSLIANLFERNTASRAAEPTAPSAGVSHKKEGGSH